LNQIADDLSLLLIILQVLPAARPEDDQANAEQLSINSNEAAPTEIETAVLMLLNAAFLISDQAQTIL
jgi:hypothetical protein